MDAKLRRQVEELLAQDEQEVRTFGQRAAENIAEFVGSWKFIIGQSALLVIWLVLNIMAVTMAWDPYPFILMNLFLSLQAAYTAPMILMSQNRQTEKDRRILYGDYVLDKKMSKVVLEMADQLDDHEEQMKGVNHALINLDEKLDK